jgi:hypothetical protein
VVWILFAFWDLLAASPGLRHNKQQEAPMPDTYTPDSVLNRHTIAYDHWPDGRVFLLKINDERGQIWIGEKTGEVQEFVWRKGELVPIQT